MSPNFSERRHFLKLLLGIIYCPVAPLAMARQKSSHTVCWVHLGDGTVEGLENEFKATGPPGSLMKLVAAAALLEENLPGARRTIDCRGTVIVNHESYSCLHPHGRICLTEAIGQSCNVFFAKAAQEINLPCFHRYLAKFSLIPAAASLPPGRACSVDYVLGLAKGFETTSLQILQLVAAIALRGRIPPMHLARETKQLSSGRTIDFADHTWNVLQEGMKIAARSGTAKNLDQGNKLHVAVKTGTTLHGQKFQSWLAGYFPYEEPRYAFCLRANVGTSYGEATPLARQFLFSKNWP